MQILVVAGTLTGLGGIETCIRNLSQEADARGDHVRVLALAPSGEDTAWQRGLDYTEVSNGSPSLKKQMVRGLPAIVRHCRAHPPDVVLVIYSSAVPLVRLALLFAGLRRPVVAWLHFSTAHKQRTNLLRYAHGHLCISSEIAEGLKNMDGIDADRVHLVFNGTRFENAEPLPRSTHGRPLRLMHVGRLMMGRQKRTDDVLRALSRVDGAWELHLVGASDLPEDVPALKLLAERLGIAHRLTWHGRQPDPWRVADSADLLILSSEFEGFPMVLIEGMARGVPCLSSDCSSGPGDIVRHGHNGWLFPVGDESALANHLQRIVDDPSQLPPAETVRASVEAFSSRRVFGRMKEGMAHAIEQVSDKSAS